MYEMLNTLDLATCICCGCNDDRACRGGCGWLRVDRVEGAGVCTQCPDAVTAWDNGERQLVAAQPAPADKQPQDTGIA